jgi:hypothetical protein
MQSEAEQAYDTATMQFNKYQSMVAQLPVYEEENKRLSSQLAKDDSFYEAKTTSLAVAKFQQDLQSLIEQSGANLISMQVANSRDKSDTNYTPVKLKLRLQADNTSLISLIHQLESRQPAGFIDSLKITSQSSQYGAYTNNNSYESILETTIEYITFIASSYER